jgi:hypothetical protein
MPAEKVSWKTEKDGVTIAGDFEFDMPDTVAAAVEKFGEETVRLGFKKSAVIYLQAYARREATKEENPKTPTEIAESIPGLKITFSEREAVDPVEKVLSQFGKLTEEKKAALLASLKEMSA